MSNLPIKFQELFQLQNLSLPPESFVFSNTTLQSDKYICIRDTTAEPQQAVIVDLENTDDPTKFPVTADSAIMNPSQNILALKAGPEIQVYHIGEKRKVKDHTMKEQIIFWKWVSDTTIALVTKLKVYHWSIEGNYPPSQVFTRLPNLEGTQIINYQVDNSQQWLLLTGIAKKDGRVVGTTQLHSLEKNLSQHIEAHAGVFCRYSPKLGADPITLFAFVNRSASGAKLFVLELGSETGFKQINVQFYFPKEAAVDFPVAIQASDKYGVVYMITKLGYLYVFDLISGKTIYMNRISAHTIFTTCKHSSTSGLLGINTNGQVLSVSIDEENIVPYICNSLNDMNLAINFSSRNNLPGADELFIKQFNLLFQSGQYQNAATVAAEAPNNILRTTQTIENFKMAPSSPNQPSPLLQYFSVLLEKGILNKIESLELVKPVLQQGNKQLVERWFSENKLECSEELGDLVTQVDINLGLNIYYRAESHSKVVTQLSNLGKYPQIIQYSKKTGYVPDWTFILQNILALNPQGAIEFVKLLLNTEENKEFLDVNVVIELFMQRNMIQDITEILLNYLKEDKEEEGEIQTRLLEISLHHHQTQLVNGIMANNVFSHYDKPKIAKLLENAGMYQRALEHYDQIQDIKRVLAHAQHINGDFLVEYFIKLSVEESLECLKELLNNKAQNIQTIVRVATKYSEQLTPQVLIDLFEEYGAYDILFFYLQSIINFNNDPEVHFKYIEAACKTNNYTEVERIVKDSSCYEPVRVKEFLKEQKLQDQIPLIIVCDKHNFVDDLTQYLYHNNMSRYIEVYVQQVNPNQTPAVVGALLDVDCNEDYIKTLITGVGSSCPVQELVEACEKRNRLKLLLRWLEDRINVDNNNEPATHNALAKIYIDINNNAEQFLLNNQYYESKIVGKYCENRDPHLAVIAYKRGLCDDELVDVTNKNGLFRKQARYLIERQDEQLWEKVLSPDNEYLKSLVEQVVQISGSEIEGPEEVSSTVKALMTADLPEPLIELLEKIILEGTQFSTNKNLQNLLILTAIRSRSDRVMDYVNRLEDYDAPDIANIAVGSELYEEAFVIFKKFKHNSQAIQVLIKDLDNIERAYEFAEYVNEPDVYSELAQAQLSRNLVKESIESFIKASDHQFYVDVINAAKESEMFEDLTKYLLMCKKMGKNPQVETELIYCYAKTNSLRELTEFISGPNCAQIQNIGDRCYNEGLYEAAKLLFNNISNFARLATTLVKLEDYSGGVEAARKANSTRTWKEVCYACVDASKFRLAQICGLHIIVHADELSQLIIHYEELGHFENLIELLEAGLNLERSHVGIFTELAILYSKYVPNKLYEHLRLFYSRMNIPKVLRICEKNQQWQELTFLNVQFKEYDSACLTMINHSVESWDHPHFKEIIPKVANLEIYYKSVQFYLDEQPLLVNELLSVLTSRVDHTRVVNLVRRADRLALIKPYLLSVQQENIKAVNTAINELHIEEENHQNLITSINNFDNFDSLELAANLENHEFIEFRRIAALLYKNNNRWEHSIKLSKADSLWKDAIDTVNESKNPELVEELLRFFVDENRSDCFTACTYTCYELIQPDVVLELAWKAQMMDFAMPFILQFMRDSTTRLSEIEKKVNPPELNNNNNNFNNNANNNNNNNNNNFAMNPNMMNPMPNNIMPNNVMPNMMVNPNMMNPMSSMPVNNMGMMSSPVVNPNNSFSSFGSPSNDNNKDNFAFGSF